MRVEGGTQLGPKGRMYEVAIKSDPDRFLDWDAPLAEQPQPIQDIARAKLKEHGYLRANDDGPRQLTSAWKAFVNETRQHDRRR